MGKFSMLLILAGAGAAGTLARYFLAGIVQRAWGGGFPAGTMVVNVLGCFLFGLVWQWVGSGDRSLHAEQVRLVALTGFMGAFTTFSTFAHDTASMLREANHAWAMTNLAAQNVLGVLAVSLGYMIGGRL